MDISSNRPHRAQGNLTLEEFARGLVADAKLACVVKRLDTNLSAQFRK
ncbi:MAG: hypothetical protein PHW60_08150 [Kiritimatiellae bacterium]|nr:hypothetical protein [Kiritimatiellia bacterium]